MPGQALEALATGGVVDQGDAASVGRLADDLVPEHGSLGGASDLLDVRAAQPTGEHAHELARPIRLGYVRKGRLSVGAQDDSAHGRIVGAPPPTGRGEGRAVA